MAPHRRGVSAWTGPALHLEARARPDLGGRDQRAVLSPPDPQQPRLRRGDGRRVVVLVAGGSAHLWLQPSKLAPEVQGSIHYAGAFGSWWRWFRRTYARAALVSVGVRSGLAW
jgi:hypothetical protein